MRKRLALTAIISGFLILAGCALPKGGFEPLSIRTHKACTYGVMWQPPASNSMTASIEIHTDPCGDPIMPTIVCNYPSANGKKATRKRINGKPVTGSQSKSNVSCQSNASGVSSFGWMYRTSCKHPSHKCVNHFIWHLVPLKGLAVKS